MKTVRDSAENLLFTEPQSYGIAANGLSLHYFNGAGIEFAPPVAHPEQIGEVLIEVTAVEPRQHDRSGTYLEETLSATIYPRNLPLTPARSRPSRPAIGTLSLPDCASVTVPWTRPTTNTDGTPLPISEISHFTLYVGTAPDALEMNARLARTINQWTVTGLTGGSTYYFGVTCTSTSDVESFYNLRTLDLTSPLVPLAPGGFAWTPAGGGSGVALTWDAVTAFEDSSVITTPVRYTIYRDTYPGVLPSEPYELAVVDVHTTYTDTTLSDCQDYYYIVTASACGNEGTPSPELAVSRPALPDCVGPVAATLGEYPGEIAVSWSAPTARIDGSALETGDISGYRVYYGTEPYSYGTYYDAPPSPTSCTLTGLEGCQTYYINVACVDACPHEGELCSYNEVSIQATEPCDEEIPAAPLALRATGLADRVDLVWPTNTSDCDLYGYRVYYGTDAGGPYDGAGALEGTSPILFPTGSVIDGDSCRAALTGLPPCETFVVVVRAVDGCDPMNESTASPEATAQTNCTPCTADAGCVEVVATGNDFDCVRYEVYPTDGFPLTISALHPDWSGPALLEQAWAGRPLIKIWDADGSAGEDGAIGPQLSGHAIDIDDFTVPSSATCADGLPMMLRFNNDQRNQVIDLTFQEGTNLCSAEGREIAGAFLHEDFDDGDADNWEDHSGTWYVSDGEYYQYSRYGVRLTTYPAEIGDCAFEAKLKNVYGETPYLVFRAQDSNNFYMLGLKTQTNTIRLCKYQNGYFYVTDQATVSLSNYTWYLLRVEVEGTHARGYLNCELMVEVDDPALGTSGKIGLRDYQSRTYFDDIRVTLPAADLP